MMPIEIYYKNDNARRKPKKCSTFEVVILLIIGWFLKW